MDTNNAGNVVIQGVDLGSLFTPSVSAAYQLSGVQLFNAPGHSRIAVVYKHHRENVFGWPDGWDEDYSTASPNSEMAIAVDERDGDGVATRLRTLYSFRFLANTWNSCYFVPAVWDDRGGGVSYRKAEIMAFSGPPDPAIAAGVIPSDPTTWPMVPGTAEEMTRDLAVDPSESVITRLQMIFPWDGVPDGNERLNDSSFTLAPWDPTGSYYAQHRHPGQLWLAYLSKVEWHGKYRIEVPLGVNLNQG